MNSNIIAMVIIVARCILFIKGCYAHYSGLVSVSVVLFSQFRVPCEFDFRDGVQDVFRIPLLFDSA